MLKPAAGRIIRNALICGRDVPVPEKRHHLIIISIGAARLEDESSISGLFNSTFGNSMTPILSIALALSSMLCATGTTWELEVTLIIYSLF